MRQVVSLHCCLSLQEFLGCKTAYLYLQFVWLYSFDCQYFFILPLHVPMWSSWLISTGLVYKLHTLRKDKIHTTRSSRTNSSHLSSLWPLFPLSPPYVMSSRSGMSGTIPKVYLPVTPQVRPFRRPRSTLNSCDLVTPVEGFVLFCFEICRHIHVPPYIT